MEFARCGSLLASMVFIPYSSERAAEYSGDAVGGGAQVVVAAAPTEAVAFPHQADCRRSPVPTLEDTCARYLDSVRPLLSETELQHTEAVVAEVRHIGLSAPDRSATHTFEPRLVQFSKEGGVGHKLQALLEARAATERNWIEVVGAARLPALTHHDGRAHQLVRCAARMGAAAHQRAGSGGDVRRAGQVSRGAARRDYSVESMRGNRSTCTSSCASSA